MGIPAGSPLSVATRHSPWDSPAVSNRSISESFYRNRLEHLLHFVRIRERDEISAVVYSAGAVLAVGAGRAGALPAGVANTTAVPYRGHRGGRSAGTGLGDNHPPRQTPSGVARFVGLPACALPASHYASRINELRQQDRKRNHQHKVNETTE